MSRKVVATSGEITVVQDPRLELLLACSRCGSRLKGGFGPKQRHTLPDAFRQLLRDAGRRHEVRVLEVGCLGICPKNGVAAMRGSRPDEMLVVPHGLDLAQLAARLLA